MCVSYLKKKKLVKMPFKNEMLKKKEIPKNKKWTQTKESVYLVKGYTHNERL